MSQSPIITDPTTPGEVLQEEFLVPKGLSATAFARVIGVVPNRVTRIIRGEIAISTETAMLFGKALGTGPEFWMNLQVTHDLLVARRSEELAAKLDTVKPIAA